MRRLIAAVALTIASPAVADQPDIRSIVENHIIPRYEALASEAATLAETAAEDCTPSNPDLIAAYHDAFDAWVAVSHLRFGPSEVDNRAFALAFWPDPRASTPKTLAALIGDEDPVVERPEAFDSVSVAARSFYALEYLLFDPQFVQSENAGYVCSLVRATGEDISRNAAAILSDWQAGYGKLMATQGNDTYRTSTEAAQQLFTALSTGLEFTSQARLGRPMGSFDRPRPNRAEAWRSQRSLRHVILALTSTRELAGMLSGENTALDDAFDEAIQRANSLGDPIFALVAEPQGRLRVEVLQQSIDAIRRVLSEQVGPSLGITAGFNSLDGD